MAFVEKSFPRGGIIKEQYLTLHRKKKDAVEFGATISAVSRKKGKRHKEKHKNINNDEDLDEMPEAISAEALTIRTITEGMLLMGSVLEIQSMYLIVSLPGRLVGQVLITSISDSYTNIINRYVNNVNDNDENEAYKSIQDMFDIGQLVCTKVKNITATTEHSRSKIQLSLRPEDVHQNFHHNDIRNGLVMSVAIAGLEEHGYVIETGVNNLRGFMPYTDIPTLALNVGELVFCKVDKVRNTPSASTAEFKFVEIGARKMKPNANIKLSHILPTTIVNFKVINILKDGIQGTVIDDLYSGYINEHQLETPLSQPTDYNNQIGNILEARVLYVMPLTNLIYLSLNLSKIKLNYGDENLLKIGAIVEGAKVLHSGTGGIVFQLNDTKKGLINQKSIRMPSNKSFGNYDIDEMMAKYYKNSLHRIRIISYQPMDSLYLCTNQTHMINEKYFSLNDVEIGDVVYVKVNQILDNGDYFVQIGNIRGYIEKMHLSNKIIKNKHGKLQCRVLRKNEKSNKIFLTNRKELLSKTAVLLSSFEKALIGLEYHGMIVKIYSNGQYLVSFCNYVKGMLYIKYSDEQTANAAKFFYVGQIMKFRIASVDKRNGNIMLSLSGDLECKIGQIVRGIVTAIQPNGLNVAFSNSTIDGFIPKIFLSSFPHLATSILDTYQLNDLIDAVCITPHVFSIKDLLAIQKCPVKQWSDIKLGDILPAYVKNVCNEVIDLQCLIKNANMENVVKIHAKMLLENYQRHTNINLIVEQLLYVRVLGKNNIMQTLTCSSRLSDVWHGNLNDTINLFTHYLQDVNRIDNCTKSFTKLRPGMIVSGQIDRIDGNDQPSRKAFVKFNDNPEATITTGNLSKNHLTVGQSVECLIIWIDYPSKITYATMKQKYIERRCKAERCSAEAIEKYTKLKLKSACGIKSDILLILHDVIVAYPRKLTNNFIYIPTKFHCNDLQPCIEIGIEEGDMAIVRILHETDNGKFIGMFEKIYQALKKIRQPQKDDSTTETRPKRKRLDSTENIFITDEKAYDKNYIFQRRSNFKRAKMLLAPSDQSTTHCKYLKIIKNENWSMSNTQIDGAFSDRYSESDGELNEELPMSGKVGKFIKKFKSKQKNKSTNIAAAAKTKSYKHIQKKKRKLKKLPISTLPGIENFWTTATSDTRNDTSIMKDDSKDNVSDAEQSKHRNMQTPAEKFKAARLKEAKICKIENDRLNDKLVPSTKDDYERLVLGTPNDSATWISYMVFHLQSNNVNDARNVAKIALRKISYREEQELLNIWVALLNLELRYGDTESFEQIFKNALLSNDPFKIYAKCIQILTDIKRIKELTDMIAVFTRKFRSVPECWPLAAHAYFEVGLCEKGKQLLHRALASLTERDHVNTIIKFANLNNRFNQKNDAHALLEQVLTSYPKRVDCWSQYVDMLIKDKEIDLARQILERSITQKIPLKKKRILFKKYLDFEERFGDEKSIKMVKTMASSYIDAELKHLSS